MIGLKFDWPHPHLVISMWLMLSVKKKLILEDLHIILNIELDYLHFSIYQLS